MPDTLADATPAARLPPLYYLHNFRAALATLKERYNGLLSADELDFIERFECAREPAQCLLTRLAMRKGPFFRRATLRYAEIADCDAALRQLVALGWIDPDPGLCAQQLTQVLSSQELRLATGIRRGRPGRRPPPGLGSSQMPLPLAEGPIIHRSLSQWHPGLAGSIVQLHVEPLLKRLRWLFFGNPERSWAEFVLSDLGVKRYERISVNNDARAFQSRQEISHFYRLNECRANLEAGRPVHEVLESAFMPQGVPSWLIAEFVHLQIRLGEELARDGNPEAALKCYRACGNADGLVRAVRLQLRRGLHEEARRDAVAAQSLPCSESQHEALERALARIRRRQDGTRTTRTWHHKPDVIELALPQLGERDRVELAVIRHLREPGSKLVYVENSLVTSLFGLLFWEAIFAPVQGAFFHPFQAGPADLYTAEFLPRRASQFHALLALVDGGQHDALIQRQYGEKAGLFNPFVRWRRLKPELLQLALTCIPAPHLKLYFARLLDDLEHNATGMPDLIQFWPVERRYRLIEVKAPGDRLQDNQRRWFRFFARHDIPATVCQVHWIEPANASA